MGDLVVVDGVAHAGIDALGHLCAEPAQHLGGFLHAPQRDVAIHVAAAEKHGCCGKRARIVAGRPRLKQLQDTVVAKGGKRLLVCIDGLDAMPAPGSGAFEGTYPILDLLPATAELPQGVLLLLTSRPAQDCPTGLFERMTEKFGGAGFVARDITLNDKEYVELLQKYFREKLRVWFRRRCIKFWDRMLESKTKFEKGGRDQRLTDDPGFRDALKDDWKKLTNKYPRYSGMPLPVTTITGILDENDKLWTDMMDKTEQRFGLVALMIARLADGSLALEQVADLPKGDDLLAKLEAIPAPAAA